MSTALSFKPDLHVSEADGTRDSSRMLKTLLANIDGMVYRRRLDTAGTMEFVSNGCLRVTGHPPGDLRGNHRVSYDDLIVPEDRLWVREAIRCAVEEGRPFDLEYRIVHAQEGMRWVWERGSGVWDDGGRPIAVEGLVQDITRRKDAEQALREAALLANYDTLTGLANRALLQDRLQQALLTTASSDRRVAVAFVDLDRFKFINDSLGHHVGDELLKTVATRLKSCVRDCDTVARLGGDEFVLLLNGHNGPDSVRLLMEKMLAAVSAPWVIPQGEFLVSCSIGVALHPEDGEDAFTLLKHADSAMYRAKENGRNNFQFFTRELNALMTEQLQLEVHLRRALERNQLILRYQPRVNLVTGQMVGMEALLRWRIPERGTIAPGRFIALAEETGLIVPIGGWVLRTACAQNKAWQDAGLAPMVVSVNVSPRQFRHESLVQTVAQALESSGLDGRYLELELTESMVMHDAPQLVTMLDELKSLGVQIAVDDFGTGYSSLSYLKRFPVDRLKVDRSFVEHMTSAADDATIVRAIIALGHNLGLKVVAEGVENAQQARALRAYQCDEAQGFLFARAASARDIPRLATKWTPDPRA